MSTFKTVVFESDGRWWFRWWNMGLGSDQHPLAQDLRGPFSSEPEANQSRQRFKDERAKKYPNDSFEDCRPTQNERILVDAIYLNKRDRPSDTSAWAYYRVTSEGKDGDHIEICTLEWPSLRDLDIVGDEKKAVVVNPGDTGYVSAFPNLFSVLANKWNIEHSDDDLIGIRVRAV